MALRKHSQRSAISKHTEQIIKQFFEPWMERWKTEEFVEDRSIDIDIEEEGCSFSPWYPLEAAVFCHCWDMVEMLSERGCKWHNTARTALLMKGENVQVVISINELLWYEIECYIEEQTKKDYWEENKFWEKALCSFEKLFSGMDSSEQNIFFMAVMRWIHFNINKLILDGLKQDIWLFCPTFCQYYADNKLQQKSMDELNTWFKTISAIVGIEGVKKIIKGYINYQINKGSTNYVIRVLKENIVEWLIVWIKEEGEGLVYFKGKEYWDKMSKIQQEFEVSLDLLEKYCDSIPNGATEYCTILLRIWKIWRDRISDLYDEIRIDHPAEYKAVHDNISAVEKWGDKAMLNRIRVLATTGVNVTECFWELPERHKYFYFYVERLFGKELLKRIFLRAEMDIFKYLEKNFSIYRYSMSCGEVLERLQFNISDKEVPLVISFFRSIKIRFNGSDMDALLKLQKGILNSNSEEVLIAAIDCGAFPNDNMDAVLQYVRANKLQYALPILISVYYDAK